MGGNEGRPQKSGSSSSRASPAKSPFRRLATRSTRCRSTSPGEETNSLNVFTGPAIDAAPGDAQTLPADADSTMRRRTRICIPDVRGSSAAACGRSAGFEAPGGEALGVRPRQR